MAKAREQQIEHLLRRAGFGASQAQVDAYADMGFRDGRRLQSRRLRGDPRRRRRIDRQAGIRRRSRRAARSCPPTNITDARQRWLFRMVHSQTAAAGEDGALLAQPLRHGLHQDRGALGAARSDADAGGQAERGPGGVHGQIELFREHALGNFRDLLVAVAQDPAMLVWLDGRTNVRPQPQENFARELMELFTMGVGTSPRRTSMPARACSPAGT